MKNRIPTLAACLLGIGLVKAQTAPVELVATRLASEQQALINRTDSYALNTGSTPVSQPGVSSFTQLSTYRPANRVASPKQPKAYQSTAFGIYGGINSTRFTGEPNFTGSDFSGRLGYQLGFFVRGGGRVFGQIGGEYFTSSSNYTTKGTSTSLGDIKDQVNIRYIQVPVYIGLKVLQSKNGASALRIQVGAEYAHRINATSGQFNLASDQIKRSTVNALGQVGIDIGPLLVDLTYHHGLTNSFNDSATGFVDARRRMLTASVGLKF